MARSYPIWNDVLACIYKASKSFGAKNTSNIKVRVGSSAQNSHLFVEHTTTHREHDNGDREFRFYVDGECIRRAVLRKGKRNLEWLDPHSPLTAVQIAAE